MKRPQYVFRPNLNDPQHRRAWALLQQVPPAKRKEFLVQSIKQILEPITLVWLYAVRALFCPCGAGTSGQHGSNFIPGAAPRRPIQIYPKNLNGGKADGSYHQL